MSAHRLFAAGGPLARALPAYKPREAQMQMAQAVEESFAGGAYVFEAGTGTGKTFAYLAPLLANGVSALISTGARALQDQLIHRDLPLLQKALQRRAQVAVLKGRANYVCKLALQNPPPAELFDSAAEASAHWRRIVDFAATDDEGDIRDIANVPANSPALQGAVSTRESCPAQQCEHYDKCFLYAARARAKNADIVIVNHHLFLSDMRLKDEGVAEILPSRDLLLFDEAHLLPQLAPQFLGESASTALLLRLAQDGERVGEELCADSSPVFAACARLRKRAQTLAKLAQARGEARLSRAEAQDMPAWRRAIAACARALPPLAATLARRAKDGQAVEKLAARAAQAARLFELWQKDEPAPPARQDDDANDEAAAGEVLESPAARWLECNDNGLATLHRVPISSDGAFAKVWQKTKTVVFASATLSVDGNFSDFCDALGLQGAQTRGWQSPYDFPNRALLFMPPNLPPPNDAAHPRQVAEVALPLVRANGGRAFVLFSSWRALRVAAEVLAPALAAGGFELLTQGDASNDELLARFRAARRGVLLGSQSFWQGVDVKGEALSLVVVDKIPFSPPTDPLLQARDAWRKSRNEEPFMRNQLPPAVILMKQVAGRLIRDEDDRGVFVVCDSRLQTRPYGKIILRSLPPMRRCKDARQAADFLRRASAREGAGA